MTILEALQSLSNYPIPKTYIRNVLWDVELEEDDTASVEVRKTKAFKKAKKAVFFYLSTAPNISQNGVSFSLSAEDKASFKRMAIEIENELEGGNVQCGYIGDDY